jgi:hypothetical protein
MEENGMIKYGGTQDMVKITQGRYRATTEEAGKRKGDGEKKRRVTELVPGAGLKTEQRYSVGLVRNRHNLEKPMGSPR